jgi:hypothetical protein
MPFALKNILLTATIVASTAATTLPAATFIQPKLIVGTLPSKSALATNTSQDLLLRAAADGSAYLYVEQQQGALLAVFDVTDPSHIKLAAAIPTQGHGAYDFVAPLGDTAELVSFRDGAGTAIIDLRKPKSPSLSINAAAAPGVIEPLGSSGYLSSSVPQSNGAQDAGTQPRDVELVENSRSPHVLVSLTGVTRQAERLETGTVFLLAQGKVTVIRRPAAEDQYETDQLLRRNMN